jgi:hypothetical protein
MITPFACRSDNSAIDPLLASGLMSLNITVAHRIT